MINEKVNANARKTAKTMWMIYYAKWNDCVLQIHVWQNECQPSIINFRACKSSNSKLIWLWLYIIELLAAFTGKNHSYMLPTPSWKERQWSIINFWSCILGNLIGDRLPIVIKELFAACIWKTNCYTLPAPSWKWRSMEHQRLRVLYLR